MKDFISFLITYKRLEKYLHGLYYAEKEGYYKGCYNINKLIDTYDIPNLVSRAFLWVAHPPSSDWERISRLWNEYVNKNKPKL